VSTLADRRAAGLFSIFKSVSSDTDGKKSEHPRCEECEAVPLVTCLGVDVWKNRGKPPESGFT
jgi:hypothetical protein